MTGTSAAALRRDPESSNRATLLELLLDVFYVATFAQLSMQFATDSSWGRIAENAILLLAAWWTWSVTASATEFYDPNERVIRGVIGSSMLGVVTMTIAMPAAFGERGLLFAGAYIGLHLVRGVMLVTALRRHRAQARAERFLFWFVVSGFLWIAGGFVDPTWRIGFWGVALVIDYVAAALRYPTPGLNRVPLDEYDRLSVHFGERYQQITILVIGDLVLVATLKFDAAPLTPARIVTFLAALITALLLWQIYVFRTGTLVESSIHESPHRAVRLAPYVYAGLVAGVIATSAGVDLVLHQPLKPAPSSCVVLLVGGPALFVLGRVIFEYALLRRFSRSRLGWLVVLVGGVPALKPLAPVFVMIATTGVLLGITLTDGWRRRRDASAR